MRIPRPIAAVLLALACIEPVQAQVFPSKRVQIVVPFPAGGTVDVLARAIGEQLAAQWGQPVVVDNRPGAGSLVATQFVQRAAGDGHTLLMVGPSFLMNPMLSADAKYDPTRDFTPVALAVTSPLVLVVNPTLPARSLKELIDESKANPAGRTFASVGPGSMHQMIGEMLKQQAQVDWVYVPYPGGAAAVTALMGNHVTAVIANYSEVAPQVAAGKLRALAVGTRERMDSMKEVPTLAELGFDAVEGTIWFGFVAPAGVPAMTVERIRSGIARALNVAGVRERLVAQGLFPVADESFGRFMGAQADSYRQVVKRAGMKAP